MNAKARFLNALHGQPVDRPPVAGVVTSITLSMMDVVGVCWPEAHHRSTSLATLAAAAWEVGHLESIKLPFDMSVEFEALGGTVSYGTRDTLPQDDGRVLSDPVATLPLHGFLDRGRVPVVLAAITSLRRRYDAEVAVISSIVGPFTLAAKLFGFDVFFGWIAENPAAAAACLDATLPLCRLYAEAQLNAGADAILIGEAAASGDLISARTYRDLVLPRHQPLCRHLGGPSILHVCGKTTRHLPHVAESGATGFSFDEKIDPAEARRWLKGRVALVGWVPTLDPLLKGTPDAVTDWANRCLEEGADVLAAGCSLPPHTPDENLAAMVQAAAAWHNTVERGRNEQCGSL